MSEIVNRFAIHVEQIDGFEFRVHFDKDRFATLELDEPPPLGHDVAPNAARVLAAAIGNCLAASLVFCLRKARREANGVRADVDVEIVRNDERRLRIGKVAVVLHAPLPPDAPELGHCVSTFEDFCIVTQSVRAGIDVDVKVVTTP